MRYQKPSPRNDYRQRESQRTKESLSLSEKFRELKSLTVELAHFSAEGFTQNSQLKYTVNTENARSVFRFDCPNNECVGGDFDLSEALARAVAGRHATAGGEVRCQGWMSKTTMHEVHCHNILRYSFSLEYGTRAPIEAAPLPVV